MKRILLSAAVRENERYLYDDQPYTGVGFERRDERIVVPYQLLEGRIVGPYMSLCEEGTGLRLHIDLEGASGDYEQVQYQGKPFVGVGYEFDDEFCVFESAYGIHTGGSAYYEKSGMMTQCTLTTKDVTESCDWFLEGTAKRYETRNDLHQWLIIRFSPKGLLEWLHIDNGVLNAIRDIYPTTRFMPLKNEQDLYALATDSDFSLVGNDVTDDVFERMAKSGMFQALTTLQLRETRMSSLSKEASIHMPNLQKVAIYNDDEIFENLSKSIRDIFPTIEIIRKQ